MDNHFAKANYYNYKALFGIIFLIFISIAIYVFIRDKEINHYIIQILSIITILIILCEFFAIYLDKFGLYLCNQTLYFQRIKRRIIDIDSIIGIKVIKSQVDSQYGIWDLKDLRGNNLYSMIFLSDITDSMIDYSNGDIMFLHEFKKHIICRTVYNKEFIDYLIRIRSDIRIM